VDRTSSYSVVRELIVGFGCNKLSLKEDWYNNYEGKKSTDNEGRKECAIDVNVPWTVLLATKRNLKK